VLKYLGLITGVSGAYVYNRFESQHPLRFPWRYPLWGASGFIVGAIWDAIQKSQRRFYEMELKKYHKYVRQLEESKELQLHMWKEQQPHSPVKG